MIVIHQSLFSSELFYLTEGNSLLKCEENLGSILQRIPLQWGLDIQNLETLIRHELFGCDWKRNCENHFRTLIQANI